MSSEERCSPGTPAGPPPPPPVSPFPPTPVDNPSLQSLVHLSCGSLAITRVFSCITFFFLHEGKCTINTFRKLFNFGKLMEIYIIYNNNGKTHVT